MDREAGKPTELNTKHTILITALAPDDTNRTFDKIISSLHNRDAEIKVITWDRTGTKPPNMVREGVDYCYIMFGWGYKNWTLLLAKPLWVIRLFFYLLHERPNIIWAATFETALPTMLASIFTRIPYIYYIHDNFGMSYSFPTWIRIFFDGLDHWIMRRAAAVIVPDDNRIPPFAKHLRKKIYSFVNSPNGKEAPPLRPAKDGPFTIYATGSIQTGRGIDILLNTCERFPEYKVLIAGRTPEKRILDNIKHSEANIDFRGEVSHQDALDLYNEADIVFAFYDPSLPVYRLASPTKLYESMMMGKPVIVNEEASISAKVREWDIGYTSAYSDGPALENLLHQISISRSDAAAKGKKARQLFEQVFDWGLIEEKLWHVVNNAAI